MKHNILSLALLALLCGTFLAGCEKETEYNTIITVKGTDAKTHYNPSTHGVVWDEGDQIAVVRGNSTFENPVSAFTIQWPVASNGEAKFTGNIPDAASTDAAYFALYPYQTDVTVDAGKITCTAIPHNQTLTTNSFGKGNNTAVGYDASTTMQFRNVGGLAKIAIYSEEYRVKSLKIVNTSTSGTTTLSGRGTINLLDSDLPISWASSDTYSEVVATATDDEGIDVSEPKFFYLALPPCTMTKYRIVIVDHNNDEHAFDFDTTATISRASVTMLGAYEVIDNTERRKIYYTSTDCNIVNPFTTSGYGANIVSNTYSDGQGVITFDGPVTQIPGHAFKNCTTLSSISLPYAVASIGQHAFYYCTNLTSVEMQNRVTSIAGHVFQNCSSLTNVVLSNRLSTVGEYVFSACTSLQGITLPTSLTSIGDFAFYQSGLTSLTIPASVSAIPNDMCYECTSLATVNLPGTTSSIGESAFRKCSSLMTINCTATSAPAISTRAFDNVPNSAMLHLPSSCNGLTWNEWGSRGYAYDL